MNSACWFVCLDDLPSPSGESPLEFLLMVLWAFERLQCSCTMVKQALPAHWVFLFLYMHMWSAVLAFCLLVFEAGDIIAYLHFCWGGGQYPLASKQASKMQAQQTTCAYRETGKPSERAVPA